MAKPRGKLQITRVTWQDGTWDWCVNDGFHEMWADTWPEILAAAEEWMRNG